mmetsp:Transcript_35553/g.77286  ORF Transcript_35553/g.77286 Transcript_35553/m.77286 type:complete len:249 (+) Transcript_35553:2320-3066(+)
MTHAERWNRAGGRSTSMGDPCSRQHLRRLGLGEQLLEGHQAGLRVVRIGHVDLIRKRDRVAADDRWDVLLLVVHVREYLGQNCPQQALQADLLLVVLLQIVRIDRSRLAPLPHADLGPSSHLRAAANVDVPLLPIQPFLLFTEPRLLVALLEKPERDLSRLARVPLHPVQHDVHLLVDRPLQVPVHALHVRYVEELQVHLPRPNQPKRPVEEHRVQNAAQDVLHLVRVFHLYGGQVHDFAVGHLASRK